MYQPTAYAYAAVIGYNTARTPGYGSAIFLHATTGSSTAGCVSLPSSQLVPVLRWLNWYKRARVIMGPESAVTYR
jgi:L,D-peptidoglycan transpeptidase YkuD (ErfK/YbiS/YcfS/YnhG family)